MANEINMSMDLEDIFSLLEGDNSLPPNWFTVEQYHEIRKQNGYTLSKSSTQNFLKGQYDDGILGRGKFRVPPEYRMVWIYWPLQSKDDES